MSTATEWTISGVREGLQTRKVSARELATELLGRIERRNPELNAFLALSPGLRAKAHGNRGL